MSADKYPSIFSRQMKAIVYIMSLLSQSVTNSNGLSNHTSTEQIISLNPEITDKVVLHYHSES